jgi:phage terminase large subunit-like protein
VEPWQASDFALIDHGLRRAAGYSCEGGTSRAWIERPRGHSKTSDIALAASWWLFAAPRRVAGIVAAADQDQAALLRDALAKLVQLNNWLGALIEVQRDRALNRVTGSALEIITSDVASSYGHNVSLIVADEVSHWAKRDLWDSLLSSAAKRGDCLFVNILNAGFQDSWTWGAREAVRVDPAWTFARLDGPCASWITEERLAEQRRLLPPAAFARLWLNQWASGAGDALPEDAISRALTLTSSLHAAEGLGPGWVTVSGLDLGLRRDASALVVLGKHVGHVEEKAKPKQVNRLRRVLEEHGYLDDAEADAPETIYHAGTGRLRLLATGRWDASRSQEVSIDAVEKSIARAHARFNFAAVACDRWESSLLAERLRTGGIPAATIDATGSNLKEQAAELMRVFGDGMVDLYPDENLLRDLRAARVTEKSYGFRIESPRDAAGHGDTLSAFNLALLAARRLDYTMPAPVAGELVCWP